MICNSEKSSYSPFSLLPTRKRALAGPWGQGFPRLRVATDTPDTKAQRVKEPATVTPHPLD